MPLLHPGSRAVVGVLQVGGVNGALRTVSAGAEGSLRALASLGAIGLEHVGVHVRTREIVDECYAISSELRPRHASRMIVAAMQRTIGAERATLWVKQTTCWSPTSAPMPTASPCGSGAPSAPASPARARRRRRR